MNTNEFGQQLKKLRKGAGLTQQELGVKLQELAKQRPESQRRSINNRLISDWERERKHPTLPYLIDLVKLFSIQLDIKSAQQWATKINVLLPEKNLKQIFSKGSRLSLPPPPLPHPALTHIEPLPQQKFFGLENDQETLVKLFTNPEGAKLVGIEGLGGIGKTTLARLTVENVKDDFYEIGWVSAKQEEFLPHVGTRSTDRPALDEQTFVDSLLEQLTTPKYISGKSPRNKLNLLSYWLKEKSYLVVVDNLETAIDYLTLLPLLRKLANPSRFLITSRQGLREQSDVFSLRLSELSPQNTFDMLRYAGETQSIPALREASKEQLEQIYQVVGGNPLALKLVIGQVAHISLPYVLDNLRQANSKHIDQFYKYIYWQAWNALDETTRKLLTIFPLTQGGNLSDLIRLSKLNTTALHRSLQILINTSLVEVGGTLSKRRYYIHRLTETFLLEEVFNNGN